VTNGSAGASASGPISFSAAFDELKGTGTAQVVAAFQIGWEVEQLRIQSSSAGTSQPQSTGEPADGDGDSPSEQSKRRLLRIAVAMDVLPVLPAPSGKTGQVVAELFKGGTAYPDITNLIQAVEDQHADGIKTAVDAFEGNMRRVLAIEKATSQLPASADNAGGAPSQRLMSDAFELGMRLAAVRCGVQAAEDVPALEKCLSLQQVDSNSARAVTLLGSLQSYFPSGAAYAVAQHIEDWSAWAAGDPVGAAMPLEQVADMSQVKAAMQSQGKIWESILTGESEGKNYVVAASYADAADHLLETWSLSLASLVQSLRRTLIGRITFWGTGILVVAFIAAFVAGFINSGTLSGGDKALIAVGGAVAAVLAAVNIHVTRTQVNTTIARMWDLTEPSLVNSEVYEAIAIATRRLPAEGRSGGAGVVHRRAKAALLAKAEKASHWRQALRFGRAPKALDSRRDSNPRQAPLDARPGGQ
jgi:hypothetical protein